MNKTKITFLTALLFAALGASASSQPGVGPGGGTIFDKINIRMSTSTHSVSGTALDNPCTAAFDAYTFEGGMQAKHEVWTLPNGNYEVVVDETTAMTARSSSGNQLNVTGSSKSDVIYAPKAFTLLKYKKMNTGDDFHAVFVMDFNPLTLTFTVTLTSACGNGMPDSKE